MVQQMKQIITLVALLSLTSIGWAGTNREATNDRLDHAGRVLHEIMAAPDSGIPEEVLEHAKCVAVVPHLLKGGFVFGAENGRGVATCRTANGWSAPVFFAITGGSWGLQIGVEGIDLVMIIQDERGMHQLLSQQVRDWRGRICRSRSRGPPCFCKYGLEIECGDSHLLPRQGRLCRTYPERRFHSARRRFHNRHLRPQCFQSSNSEWRDSATSSGADVPRCGQGREGAGRRFKLVIALANCSGRFGRHICRGLPGLKRGNICFGQSLWSFWFCGC